MVMNEEERRPMLTVLIIDDQSVSRMILSELIGSIQGDIRVEAFGSPIVALEWAKTHSVDLVLTDFKMPVMNGVEFTQWFRQIPVCADVPVIVVTCVDDKAVKYRALEAGATDFLSKPIDHYECRARCRNLLKLRQQQQLIKERAKSLEQEVLNNTTTILQREKETLIRLAQVGEYRGGEEDIGHVYRVARYARLIAETLGFEAYRCDIIEQAASLHDIGNVGIPDRILLKPGKLNAQEWETVKTHTAIGYEILHQSSSCFLGVGAIIARSHHERYDGSGYPQALKGEEIPIQARIVAIADVYDVLCSRRIYKQAWSIEQASGYIKAERGRHFDPGCVDAFLANRDKLPAIALEVSATQKLVNLE